MKPSSRNLILCFDGTNNKYASSNTNVVKIVSMLDRENRDSQLFYYQTGVGTVLASGTLSRIKRAFHLGVDKAVAWLLPEHVQAGYRFLMRFYRPGDRIYLVGFSRGAFTARALAGMLHRVGLLPKGNEELVSLAWHLYSRERDHSICGGFKATFSRDVRVNFMGLFDTVSSFGWAWMPRHLPFTARNPSVDVVRHAVALDERRAKFVENMWGGITQERSFDAQDVKQVWFAGVHSDVGGGYSDTSSSNASLRWMLGEMATHGAILNREAVEAQMWEPSGWVAGLHESLAGLWWLIEFLPLPCRKRNGDGTYRSRLLIHAARRRGIRPGALVHESVRQRIEHGLYDPALLPERVRYVEDAEVLRPDRPGLRAA